MCRYGIHGPYKPHFACFQCRKAFKQSAEVELSLPQRAPQGEPRVVRCPQCRGVMVDMGLDFKAPKQSDQDQWKKVELLYHNGVTFHSCGCGGPGYRPADLKEAQQFVASRQPVSEGEALLRRIQARAARA